ncbi:DUF2510 domain-containing protein [Desertihabitans brevis]|uniref:DUF2510 domain-containing protein n=1 Tax=Desertihabitans brevis TaxID=2268447 RepID=A0A367YWT2_9ACTN|nr:DUF2510 domain-containing protein [Desertihabitans brevis]
MAVPGWYPDPSRPNQGYRWFDGTRWTGHTTSDPHRPAPTPPHPARARSQLAVVAALVLVAALVGGLLLALGARTSGPSASAPRPTVSAWDEVTTPPASPTPTPVRPPLRGRRRANRPPVAPRRPRWTPAGCTAARSRSRSSPGGTHRRPASASRTGGRPG